MYVDLVERAAKAMAEADLWPGAWDGNMPHGYAMHDAEKNLWYVRAEAALAAVATPEEVAALRAEVARAGAACADMGAEIVRLRAEVASMRVTLGQQPPAEGAEPIGCPLPGMCSMVAATSTLRARVAELEAALEELIGPYTGGADSTLDDPYIMDRARAALEGKDHE